MALDAYGVTASLQPVCPMKGAAGPYTDTSIGPYPDGNGAYWRLDFADNATTAQQQSAITTLASITSYTAPTTTTLTPYRLAGSISLGATLAVGTTTMSVAVAGLLRTDAPMTAFGTALPSGVDVRSTYPDLTKDGSLIVQVAVLSALSGTMTVPFTLIGVR
jgi:hypothetical protein